MYLKEIYDEALKAGMHSMPSIFIVIFSLKKSLLPECVYEKAIQSRSTVKHAETCGSC
jgi:hypothetical protein